MGLDLKLEINPEDVERMLVDSITKSALGEAIGKAISRALSSATVGTGYNRQTIVEAAVDEVLRNKIRRLVQETIDAREEEIRAAISEKLTQKTIDELVELSWSSMRKE